MEAEVAVPAGNLLGEGPVWNVDEQALYWVDIDGQSLQRFLPASGAVERWTLGVKVGSYAFRAQGGLVLATSEGFCFWDRSTQTLERIEHPEQGKPEARFNDGKVDPGGRFWAGTMTPRGATSTLYRLDPDRRVRRMVTEVTISNGLGWSPDGRVMYHADTLRHTIFAYDYQAASGEISNRRVFYCFLPREGVPDGLTVDQEGAVWCALWGGWKVVRLSPAGERIDEVAVPVAQPSSCAFGGADLDELYITSASVDLSQAERQAQPLAGSLFRARPGCRGRAEPLFQG